MEIKGSLKIPSGLLRICYCIMRHGEWPPAPAATSISGNAANIRYIFERPVRHAHSVTPTQIDVCFPHSEGCVRILLAEPSDSIQPQALERGTSRSSTDVRHDNQFKNRDFGEVNPIVLGLAYGFARAEIPPLAHNVSERASAIGRPS